MENDLYMRGRMDELNEIVKDLESFKDNIRKGWEYNMSPLSNLNLITQALDSAISLVKRDRARDLELQSEL